MSEQKNVREWFAEYGFNHQHPVNQLIHWLCVPVLSWCVLAFIWSVPVPASLRAALPWFDWALPAIAAATMFYVRLSPALAAGMLVFLGLCYWAVLLVAGAVALPLWKLGCMVFMAAWALQFVGHVLERRRPSFAQDLIFLLIGPAWLMGAVYRKFGWKF